MSSANGTAPIRWDGTPVVRAPANSGLPYRFETDTASGVRMSKQTNVCPRDRSDGRRPTDHATGLSITSGSWIPIASTMKVRAFSCDPGLGAPKTRLSRYPKAG